MALITRTLLVRNIPSDCDENYLRHFLTRRERMVEDSSIDKILPCGNSFFVVFHSVLSVTKLLEDNDDFPCQMAGQDIVLSLTPLDLEGELCRQYYSPQICSTSVDFDQILHSMTNLCSSQKQQVATVLGFQQPSAASHLVNEIASGMPGVQTIMTSTNMYNQPNVSYGVYSIPPTMPAITFATNPMHIASSVSHCPESLPNYPRHDLDYSTQSLNTMPVYTASGISVSQNPSFQSFSGYIRPSRVPVSTCTFNVPTFQVPVSVSASGSQSTGSQNYRYPATRVVDGSLRHGYINPPRLVTFSGDPKSEVSYQQWRFEVDSLLKDEQCTPSLLMRSVRQSLRGQAFNTLKNLGSSATLQQILETFDRYFGEILPYNKVRQEFHTARQDQKESVSVWACRLENLVSKLDIDPFEKEQMLSSKFFDGLWNEKLQNLIRHLKERFSFKDLLVEARIAELELQNKTKTSQNLHQVSAKAETSKATSDPKWDALLKSINQISDRLGKLEARETQVKSTRPAQTRSVASSLSTNANRNVRPQFFHGNCNFCGQFGHKSVCCPLNG